MHWRAVGLGLVALLLSGCDGGVANPSSTSHACPQWIPGLASFEAHQGFDERITNNPTHDNVTDFATMERDEGRPVDIFDFYLQGPTPGNASRQQGIVALDSRLTLHFFRFDDHTPLLAYDLSKGTPGKSNSGQYTWTFGPGTSHVQLRVHLSQPPAQPTPTRLRVEYTFETNLDHDASTISSARMDYTAKFQYRSC